MRLRRRREPVSPLAAEGWFDQATVRFSLPTICDELPAVGADLAQSTDVGLHEDDWRQIELVSSTHRLQLAENIAAIAVIRSESPGLGFERIHVRKEPQEPLGDLNISHADVRVALGSAFGDLVGVAFGPDRRLITNGFAYIGPTSVVYGFDRASAIATLGVHLTAASKDQDAGVGALVRLADQRGAFVVDWPAALTYPPLDAG